jgi:biopolymer transport protein ExbB
LDWSETSIVNATLWLLGFFSLLTWSIILIKLGEWCLNVLRNYHFVKNHANEKLDGHSPSSVFFNRTKSQFARILNSAQLTLNQVPNHNALSLEQYTAWHLLIERALSQQIINEKAKMDSGLGLLASFGSTSPFVGLFGTVWGIMHALQDISSKGSASIEVVAGPIGEALIATAIGIGVAIPAVLAYNFFVRLNKASLTKLERFANEFLRSVIQTHLQQLTSVSTNGIPNTK